MIYFSGGCIIFFGEKSLFGPYCHYCHYRFVETLHDFFLVERLRGFILGGCVILCMERLPDFFCVERLCDFSHSLTQVA